MAKHPQRESMQMFSCDERKDNLNNFITKKCRKKQKKNEIYNSHKQNKNQEKSQLPI